MLLFIAFFRLDQVTCLNFNTSHVTVYPVSIWNKRVSSRISIHLMLLFIGKTTELTKANNHFNTSHVTVYHHQNTHISLTNRISIHLMLLFIGVPLKNA